MTPEAQRAYDTILREVALRAQDPTCGVVPAALPMAPSAPVAPAEPLAAVDVPEASPDAPTARTAPARAPWWERWRSGWC